VPATAQKSAQSNIVYSGTAAGNGVGELKAPLFSSNRTQVRESGVSAKTIALSTHRRKSVSLSGSSTASDDEIDEQPDENQIVKFSVNVATGVNRQWHALVLDTDVGKSLLLDLDKCDWQNNSKEAFIRVMECADECLACARVLAKARRPESRQAQQQLIKTFMFLGFRVMTPQAASRTLPDVDTDKYFLLFQDL